MSVNSCQNELEFINFWPIVRTQPLKASQNTQHSTIEWPSFKWLLCLILTNFFPQSLEYEDKCEYFMLIQFFLLLLSTHGRKNMLLITEKMHNMLSSINCYLFPEMCEWLSSYICFGVPNLFNLIFLSSDCLNIVTKSNKYLISWILVNDNFWGI